MLYAAVEVLLTQEVFQDRPALSWHGLAAHLPVVGQWQDLRGSFIW